MATPGSIWPTTLRWVVCAGRAARFRLTLEQVVAPSHLHAHVFTSSGGRIAGFLGTPGRVNFPGTAEAFPIFDPGTIVELVAMAVAHVDVAPLRGVIVGPTASRLDLRTAPTRRRRETAEAFVHNLRAFLTLADRMALMQALVDGVLPGRSPAPAIWRNDDLAERIPSDVLASFLSAREASHTIYRRGTRNLAGELVPATCPVGMHLHRRLTACPVTVEEPVVSSALGSATPPRFCGQCEGLAARRVAPHATGEFDVEAFILAQLRPSNGRPRGGGGRLRDGTVCVVPRDHPPAISLFLGLLDERRRACAAEAESVVRVGEWDAVSGYYELFVVTDAPWE